MKIHFDEAVRRDQRGRVAQVVREVLAERPALGTLSVSIGRYGKNRWSVFVTGSQEHPLALVESIRAPWTGRACSPVCSS